MNIYDINGKAIFKDIPEDWDEMEKKKK